MNSIDMIGSIKTTPKAVLDHLEQQGKDGIQIAIDYLLAWKDAVPVGTQTIFSRVQCQLADGYCGCGTNTFYFKCSGPHPQVPIEIIFEVLFAGIVDGIEGVKLPAPAVVKDENGKLHTKEFVGPYSPLVDGPAQAVYIKKTA